MTEAAERGSLTIEDRVVERVAGYAISLVPGAAAAPRRVLGIAFGDGDAERDARVSARVDGSTATLQAAVAVQWPLSVAAVVKDVRERVTREVKRCTDVSVDHIDVDVVSMTVATHDDAPRVR